jgi:hypothetical protein
MSKLTGVVLLEGPDGAGKTTLAEALCQKYGGHYVHRTWRKGMDVWDHHTEALQLADKLSHEQLVVIDRLWPSEAIYGKVFRKESDYKHNSRAMDRVLLRLATIHVLCVPDVDYVVETHGQRARAGGEMYSTVQEVAQRYWDWTFGSRYEPRPRDGDITEQQAAMGGFLKLRNDALHYDVNVDGTDLDFFCQKIEAHLRERQASQYAFALDPTTPNCLGHRMEAEYLFVGEQVGDLHSWSRWPFYARTHSPDFLNKALHELAFEEQKGLWNNAWDADNRLIHIWNERARPDLKVIPLGRKAEHRCKALGIPVHAAVPHPSWARRFNHHGQRGYTYADQLKEVLVGNR